MLGMASMETAEALGRVPQRAGPRPAASNRALSEAAAEARPAELDFAKLEFIGCEAVPMTHVQYREFHGRFEVWDAGLETAWMVRDSLGTSAAHEGPTQSAAGLVARIAAVRGSPINCYGSMSLALVDEHGEHRRVMQADQALYLDPSKALFIKAQGLVVGKGHFPDVVLEVDYSTDVRRGKLKLYEAWGFPEVWVDVPEAAPNPRKARGTTIYLLAGDAYSPAPESRAFPGWTAAEIHTALNEPRLSKATLAVLERLGGVLGEQEGTGPDDDPLLRSQRAQAREEGRQEARARESASRARLVRQLVFSRGLAVGERFPMDVPGFEAADVAVVADAALRCKDAADFAARLQGGGAEPTGLGRPPTT